MRLINTQRLELEEFFESDAPPYAILSHTWEEGEITFQEMVAKSPSTMAKAGYKKVQDTCNLAHRRGKKWAWVDTCCIDKSSSAELTESINSMYRWYQNAAECYAYLVDFAPGSLPNDDLEKCRWFTRGFTLQELIAPKTVILFDKDWNMVGEKKDEHILDIISRITRVSQDVLLHHQPPSDFAIAERMLWASTRQTTRPEDKAYCLLGIFEVNMPLIYGEGNNAFRRLQEEIIKRSTDLSIFAWGTHLNFQTVENNKKTTDHPSFGLFATSPADFGATWKHIDMEHPSVRFWLSAKMRGNMDFALTNRGLNIGGNIKVGTPLNISVEKPQKTCYIIYHVPTVNGSLVVLLDKVGPGLYLRLGVKILSETFWSYSDGYPFAVSTIPNTISVDHRDLSDAMNERGPFHETVSITWPSRLSVSIRRALPNTHWDASRSLFFPPRNGDYDVAWAELCFFDESRLLSNSFTLYLVIDFRYISWHRGISPRAFVLGEGDLPEFSTFIRQGQIPRHILFPGRGHQSGHLLNKGPEYGRQMVITPPDLMRPQRVTIRIETAATVPPAAFTCVLGTTVPYKQYTVMLDATFEDIKDGTFDTSGASSPGMATATSESYQADLNEGQSPHVR